MGCLQSRRTFGKGASYRVVEAIDKSDSHIKLAIKIMDKEKEYQLHDDIMFYIFLSKLRHQNIVKCNFVLVELNKYCARVFLRQTTASYHIRSKSLSWYKIF